MPKKRGSLEAPLIPRISHEFDAAALTLRRNETCLDATPCPDPHEDAARL